MERFRFCGCGKLKKLCGESFLQDAGNGEVLDQSFEADWSATLVAVTTGLWCLASQRRKRTRKRPVMSG
jgi:hypothetical protein